MSKPTSGRAAQPGNAPASGDSPKPHGDKLASARPRAPEGRVAEGESNLSAAQAPGESSKLHGDKLGSVRREITSDAGGDEAGDGQR